MDFTVGFWKLLFNDFKIGALGVKWLDVEKSLRREYNYSNDYNPAYSVLYSKERGEREEREG